MNLDEEFHDFLAVVYLVIGFGMMSVPLFIAIFVELSVSPVVYWGIGCAVVIATFGYMRSSEAVEQLESLDTGSGCDCEVELHPVTVDKEGDTAE